jgi:4'-phosphopantetheinyl transferase
MVASCDGELKSNRYPELMADLDGTLIKSLDREVHVYIAFVPKYVNSGQRAWYERLLAEDEYRKYSKLHFSQDRDIYLTAHVLLRAVLSKYAHVPPEAWAFTSNRFGRPEILPWEGFDANLRFSLSRTRGMAVCGVARSMDIGVDVEEVRPLNDLETLSNHVLTEVEQSWLRRCAEDKRLDSFFQLWTLKEAYLKAKGVGLSQPLNEVGFELDGEKPPRLSPVGERLNQAADWQFSTDKLTPSHRLAVALHSQGRGKKQIRISEEVPPECGGAGSKA